MFLRQRWAVAAVPTLISAALVGAVTSPVPASIEGASASWTQQAEITNHVSASHFGSAVAIEGSTAVIAAPDQNVGTVSGQGYVYVYDRESDGRWVLQQRLTGSPDNADDSFGQSVALLGNTLVVGSWGVLNRTGGAAFVFSRSSEGHWSQVAELTSSDGKPGDAFGYSVAISNAGILVGAFGHDDVIGSAYFYQQRGGTWKETAELKPSGHLAESFFGWSVALDGDTAVIGAPSLDIDSRPASGSGYVFHRNTDGRWIQKADLLVAGSKKDDHVGFSVALAGQDVVLGAPTGRNIVFGLPGPGHGYVFRSSGHGYVEVGPLIPAAEPGFGYSMSTLGSQLVVGAMTQDQGRGVVYVFTDTSGGGWKLKSTLTPRNRIRSGLFGRSESLARGELLIGADSDFAVGHTYVFIPMRLRP